MIITPTDLQGTVVNANLDDLYLQNAINEAEDVYLREILGDLLYNTIINKINNQTLNGKYLTLVDNYIKIYLQYKVQALLVPQVAFKIRNSGILSQYDQGFNTTSVKDTMYVQEQYDSKSEFYANRLTTYLQKNSADFPEYGYSDDNITQPTETQNVTTIFLGGGRKKGCGCNTTPQATAKTVDWDNIENKPDFADVAYTNDYDSLDNKPEIPAPQVQSDWNQTDTNEVDYIKNKPTIPTVPTDISSFNNDTGYITQEQVLAYKPFPATWTTDHTMSDLVASIDHDPNATVGKSYMDTVHLTDLPEDMVQAEVKVDVVSEIDNVGKVLVFTITSDSTKPYHWECTSAYSILSAWHSWVLPTDLPSVNDGKLTIKQGGVTKGSFTANAISNVTIDLDAGGGSTDWNDITNKPTMTAETWTFELSGGTTVTKTVWLQ